MKPKPYTVPAVFLHLDGRAKGKDFQVQIPARRFVPRVQHVKVKTYKLP